MTGEEKEERETEEREGTKDVGQQKAEGAERDIARQLEQRTKRKNTFIASMCGSCVYRWTGGINVSED